MAKTKITNLEDRRKRIEALKLEAKSFGVYITSDRLQDISRTVNRIRKQREGKPPCYWRSYEKVARECRVCEIRHDCSKGEEIPAEIPSEDLKPVPCRRCGSGTLSVEARDGAGGEVRDYGCDNKECIGTLSDQMRHVGKVQSAEKPKKPQKKPTPKEPAAKKVKKTKVNTDGRSKISEMELDHAILEFVRNNPGCGTREIHHGVTGGAKRKQRFVKKLLDARSLKRRKMGRTTRYYIGK